MNKDVTLDRPLIDKKGKFDNPWSTWEVGTPHTVASSHYVHPRKIECSLKCTSFKDDILFFAQKLLFPLHRA